MILDCHVHVAAFTPAHGAMSAKLRGSLAFAYMQKRLRIEGDDERQERDLEESLSSAIEGSQKLDAAVVLAFDAVYGDSGEIDSAKTQFYIKNDYVIELCQRHSKMLFGASIHPFRKDAIAELERCVKAGAVLVKWLPITQNFDPSDVRCFEFYDAMAHHGITLLSHTGGEQSLPTLRKDVADPMLLEPALKRGVRVIAAHCGTKSLPWERDYLPEFVRLAKEYEHCFGDTSALNLPTRTYAWGTILKDEQVRKKLVHGSDWPIIPFPPVFKVGIGESLNLAKEANWMRRDILIKEKLGLEEEYWHRAGKVLKVETKKTSL